MCRVEVSSRRLRYSFKKTASKVFYNWVAIYLNHSTVSSGVNALAASITEDYIRPWRPNLSNTQLTYVSKGTALATGLLAFAFVYIAEQMGSIFSAAVTLLGILGGPTLGIFICGQFFPWANTAVN